MTVIIKIAVFVLGMYLSMRLIASLYGIIDLWYTIRTAYPKIIRGILGWGALTVAMDLLLESCYRPAFIWGLCAYVVFYAGFIWLNKLLVLRPSRMREIGDSS